jgi:hypothetical protein
MRIIRLLLPPFAAKFASLPVLGLLAAVILLCGGILQTETDDSVAPSFTTFNAPGAGTTASALQGTAAFGINAAGDIAGFETDENGVHHGFVRTASGAITDFDASGAGTGRNQGTMALSIDSSGEIAGSYTDANSVYHGFVRADDGTISAFDVTGAGTGRNQGTNAISINSDGNITGFYTVPSGAVSGFLRAVSGTITTFEAPGAGTGKSHGTRPFGINSAGDVTGFSLDAQNLFHGFVRAANGQITVFDATGAGTAAFQGTLPFSIDSAGDVTGLYIDANGALHGFVRAASGTIADFDAPGAGTGMFQGTFPFSINSDGVIVGIELDANTVLHGFVRTADGAVTTFEAPGAGSGSGLREGERGLQGSGALAINDSGAIAGSYLDAKSVLHGFLFAAKAPTTTTLQSTPNPSHYGAAVTFTAQVASGDSSPPDGEIVSFVKSGNVFGTGTLTHGKARLTTSILPVGADSITAVYPGDANLARSASKALAQVVEKTKSTTVLTSSPNPSKPGQLVKFTATVTSATSKTPRGTVTFKNGSTTLATVDLAAGKASFDTSRLAAGVHSVTAAYGGSADFEASTSGVLKQTVK